MAKFLRYALATLCFTASLGCLALWGWSFQQRINCQLQNATTHTIIETRGGYLVVSALPMMMPSVGTLPFVRWSIDERLSEDRYLEIAIEETGRFGVYRSFPHFPLWYPVLIFALAGVGVLRFRRQFSIRSALLCVSVVAALLGMAVIL